MKVELISYTPDALNLLLRTKNTRLAHDSDPATWSEEQKAEHLAYMHDTIKSSWEMVDYIFHISGVTRAFTHQLVRTRAGSYAQESQRTVDVSGHDVVVPDSVALADPSTRYYWNHAVESMMEGYATLLQDGIAPQDARGILPTNITTSITAKFNLRTLHETAKLRLCTRTQGEYQDVFREMRARVIEVHPWAEEFIQVYCAVHGTCAFPRYGAKECPLYKYVLPQEQLEAIRSEVREHWESERHVASPRAKDGKSM